MRIVTSVAAALVVSTAIGGAAQARIIEKKALTLEAAKRVVAAAVAEARKNKAGGVIAVVDDGGNLMVLERLDGTFAAGANISGPELAANFAWGDADGKTLYMCARTGLYRIRLNVPGIRP